MPMENIVQPDAIMVDESLRLRRFDCGDHAFALEWYQDAELVKLVDGVDVPYSPEKLEAMYSYLDKHGELYFIEILEVTFDGHHTHQQKYHRDNDDQRDQ